MTSRDLIQDICDIAEARQCPRYIQIPPPAYTMAASHVSVDKLPFGTIKLQTQEDFDR